MIDPQQPGQAEAQADVLLDAQDLPAFCPNPRMPIWSGHPRVYLAVTPGSAQSCPYCGTRYALRSGAKPHSH